MKMSKQDEIEWRQDQIKQLMAKGHYSQRQIAGILQLPKSTVGRDILEINQQAKESIRSFIDERLPQEYNQVLIGIDEIIQQSWGMLDDASDVNDKIHCLALAKEAYGMKLDLLTNAAVIEDAGRFMQEKKKELEQQSSLLLQRQQMEHPPQETKQEQQQEQEPETFNKTF